MTQDVFPIAHTLTIIEPIWPVLQNLSKTLGPSLVPRPIKGKGSESGNKTNLVHASKHIKSLKELIDDSNVLI